MYIKSNGRLERRWSAVSVQMKPLLLHTLLLACVCTLFTACSGGGGSDSSGVSIDTTSTSAMDGNQGDPTSSELPSEEVQLPPAIDDGTKIFLKFTEKNTDTFPAYISSQITKNIPYFEMKEDHFITYSLLKDAVLKKQLIENLFVHPLGADLQKCRLFIEYEIHYAGKTRNFVEKKYTVFEKLPAVLILREKSEIPTTLSFINWGHGLKNIRLVPQKIIISQDNVGLFIQIDGKRQDLKMGESTLLTQKTQSKNLSVESVTPPKNGEILAEKLENRIQTKTYTDISFSTELNLTDLKVFYEKDMALD
ncbi:MAG: hypothetical protein HY390_01755 [Deltaproteobacteria bacterium]|nr:hypothetical protein [Deltaproteobacteria bacterium]